MRRKKFIIIVFVMSLFFSNCSNIRYYQIWHETISSDELFVSLLRMIDGEYFFKIRQENVIYKQIIDFDYINGYIQIGNKIIEFKRSEIGINISGNNHNFLFNEMNGRDIGSKKMISDENLIENYYVISFSKNIDKFSLNEIENEYKNGNKIIKIYFEYLLITDNQHIVIIINENFIFKIEHSIYLH